MANEATLNLSLSVARAGRQTVEFSLVDYIFSISGNRVKRSEQVIGTSEEAINLGEITAPAFCIFRNLDATNYIELKVATGGAIFGKLLGGSSGTPPAGGIACLQLGSGAQAPYAIANSSACNMEILIFEA